MTTVFIKKMEVVALMLFSSVFTADISHFNLKSAINGHMARWLRMSPLFHSLSITFPICKRQADC